MQDPKKVAQTLLNIACVQLSPEKPFCYASGLVGPIYCDNRKVLSFVEERELVVQAFIEKIKELGLEFDQLAGLATAGIPWASFIAQSLRRPLIYVRSAPKEHGKKNAIEGDYRPGQRVLLVEDLVNQGSSLEKAYEGIKEAGMNVVGCLCLVTYQLPQAQERLKRMGISLYSLTDFKNLVEAGKLSQSERELLERWHQDPQKWSDEHQF